MPAYFETGVLNDFQGLVLLMQPWQWLNAEYEICAVCVVVYCVSAAQCRDNSRR